MNEYDPIDKALDVKADIVREKRKISKKIKEQDDPTKDYEYSRAQLYNLVEKGQEAVNGILDVCQDSQHPRAYEVAGQLIKSVADTTDKLADLHKKVKEIEEDNPKTQSTVTNNALFVGSTSELSKMLKDGILNSNNSEKS